MVHSINYSILIAPLFLGMCLIILVAPIHCLFSLTAGSCDGILLEISRATLKLLVASHINSRASPQHISQHLQRTGSNFQVTLNGRAVRIIHEVTMADTSQ